MRERDFVDQFAELAARVKRIVRWQDQWSTRNRKVASLLTGGVQSTGGYFVTAAQGLAVSMYRETDYGLRAFAVGFNLLNDFTPASGYHGVIPAWVELPPKEGNVVPGVAVIFTDGTFAVHDNWTDEARKLPSAFEAASDS